MYDYYFVTISFWLGIISMWVLTAYILIVILSMMLNFKRVSDDIEMPCLSPITIPTKAQSTWLHKVVMGITEKRRWVLTNDWLYKLDDDVTILIPRGFVFDGASIPRIFWIFLSPTGLLLIPGLIHDYGYKYNQLWEIRREINNVCILEYKKGAGKEYFDGLFKQVGKQINGMIVIDFIAWLAVALGGFSAWKAHRIRNQKASIPGLTLHIN